MKHCIWFVKLSFSKFRCLDRCLHLLLLGNEKNLLFLLTLLSVALLLFDGGSFEDPVYLPVCLSTTFCKDVLILNISPFTALLKKKIRIL